MVRGRTGNIQKYLDRQENPCVPGTALGSCLGTLFSFFSGIITLKAVFEFVTGGVEMKECRAPSTEPVWGAS